MSQFQPRGKQVKVIPLTATDCWYNEGGRCKKPEIARNLVREFGDQEKTHPDKEMRQAIRAARRWLKPGAITKLGPNGECTATTYNECNGSGGIPRRER